MAENTRGIQTINKFIKGMNTDVHPIDQAPGTYRFALNMILESREGDYTSIINEEGNIVCDSLEENFVIVGTVFADKNQVIIFSVNPVSGLSEIGILDQWCVYTTLIRSSCLSFDNKYPIQGVFRLRNGCERVVYFTDDLNPLRSINLDNLQQYTLGGVDVATANATDSWDCDKFKNNRNYNVCSITGSKLNDGGGSLKAGAYMFAVRYLDIDRNPTNWFFISQPVNVGSGDTSNPYPYDGGVFDLVSVDTVNEGKSITLYLDDLDTDFDFFQLAAIELTRATGFEPTVYLINEQAVTGSSDTFTYTGFNTQRTNYTLDEVIIPKVVINRVKTLAQIDSRLAVANLSNDVKNWGEFQRLVSETYVWWNISDHPINNVKAGGTPPSNLVGNKAADYSLSYHGYMRDEIYAFGIVFVFNDGTESPVFHIPGRPANYAIVNNSGVVEAFDNADLVAAGNANTHYRNQVPIGENWDTQILTVKDTVITDPDTQVEIKDVKHIPAEEFLTGSGEEDSTIYRWKVWNTAVDTFNGSYGVMGYYECDEEYPEILDCDGNDIWGNDIQGNPLVGEKIRHHRMPDTTLCTIRDYTNNWPDTRQGTVYNLNFVVGNVQYPADYASEIQGYYVVRVERDNSNSTVIDKGFVGYTETKPDNTPPPFSLIAGILRYPNAPTVDRAPMWSLYDNFGAGSLGDDLKIIYLNSPKTYFKPDSGIYTGYLKVERMYAVDLTQMATTSSGITGIEPFVISANNILDIPVDEYTHRKIEGYFFMDPGSVQLAFNGVTDDLYNWDFSTRYLILEVSNRIHDASAVYANNGIIPYVSLKQWIKPYGNLLNLRYIRTENKLLTDTGFFTSTELIRTGGDCYITELAYKSTEAGNVLIQGDISTGVAVALDFFCESQINCDLRMTGEDEFEVHPYKAGVPDSAGVDSYVVKLSERRNDDDTLGFDTLLNYFQANFDTSAVQNYNQYFPLPYNYDYCSNCEEDFPNRIWYSERSYQESIDDKYKIFLANNYRDLYGEDSEIFKLFVHNEELYALTPYTTWFVPTRPQQLTTNEGNIYVGTGDVLSIPPKRLQTSDIGYAGSIHPHAVTSSENGVVFVDSNAGKIFLLKGQQLQEISSFGMRNWFRENLPLNILKQIKEFKDFSTASLNGAGFIACFDPEHNRVIITKRDYRLLFDIEELLVSEGFADTTGYTYGYNYIDSIFYTQDGPEAEPAEVILDEEEVEDLSWCVSFTFNNNCWDSFHSYRPRWMWNNRNFFFTEFGAIDGEAQGLWKHGERNYGEFYNETCPSVIDIVFNNNPVNTKVINSFQIISYVQEFVNDHFVDLPYHTFDKAFIYNSEQSSGILDINIKNTDTNPFVDIDNIFDSIYINYNEGTWSFSEFFDMTVDATESIFTHDWSNADYRTARIGYGFIDWPNENRIDFTKSQFEMEAFRDKWVGARLSYDNIDSYKLVTQFGQNNSNISFK